MAEAIKLSVEHKHTTKPNPVVGALLYTNGKIVSSGAHEYFGGPHAEVNCIDKVDPDVKALINNEPITAPKPAPAKVKPRAALFWLL